MADAARVEGLRGTLQVRVRARRRARHLGSVRSAAARLRPPADRAAQAGRDQPAIRLLIVDDHPVVRDGLSGMFAADPGFEVVGEAGDGAEAVRLAGAAGPT